MFDQTTPLILTYNESANIGRSLSRLSWAKEIVIVDSFSDDDTIRIAGADPRVRLYQRVFDTYQNQWNFGVFETGIKTDWVLALDADYILSDEIIEEMQRLQPAKNVSGFRAGFVYCIDGRPLRGSLYPPVTILYRREGSRYIQDGHAQRIQLNGDITELRGKVQHDDRKPLSHWLRSQSRYMQEERDKLTNADSKDFTLADRIRKLRVVAPFLAPMYCLFVKGNILDGKAGLYYSFQRTISEMILSLYLIEQDLGFSKPFPVFGQQKERSKKIV